MPAKSRPPQKVADSVIFRPVSGIDADAAVQEQATLRWRILRDFVGRGLLKSFDTKEMLAYQHSGFSVDAGGCIEAHDRTAMERLLRYCARPPFAVDRLRKAGSELVYRCAKQYSEPTSDKRDAKADELTLTPLELIDRIVAAQVGQATTEAGAPGVAPPNNVSPTQAKPAQPVPPKRPAHYLWAVLIARIYEVFPLLCPNCGGQMRLIAFVTAGTQIRKILEHIGVDSEPPHIAPARGPPLWDDCDAQMDDGVHIEPDWNLAAQPAPDYEADQRVNW